MSYAMQAAFQAFNIARKNDATFDAMMANQRRETLSFTASPSQNPAAIKASDTQLELQSAQFSIAAKMAAQELENMQKNKNKLDYSA